MNAEHPSASDTGAEESAQPRKRRPAPARTAPHRSAATLLREGAPASSARAQAGNAEATNADDSAVARGVRLGYQVIEEQILHGQKLAQRLGRKAAGVVATASGAAPPSAAAVGADEAQAETSELLERVVNLYKDLGALCVDAVEAVARNPVLRAGVARVAPAAAPAASAASGFAIDVHCSRRVQVTLDLRQRSARIAPLVHALHASDPGIPPLTGVHFNIDPSRPEPVLHLAIADAQPAATYTGVVVDAASNEPRGTLSVRVLA